MERKRYFDTRLEAVPRHEFKELQWRKLKKQLDYLWKNNSIQDKDGKVES